MPVLLRLARRNLFRYKSRTFATVLGVALGIAAVLATLSIGDNVEANVKSALEAAAGKADLLVTPGAEGRSVFCGQRHFEGGANNARCAEGLPGPKHPGRTGARHRRCEHLGDSRRRFGLSALGPRDERPQTTYRVR